jgi:hypothetical protein
VQLQISIFNRLFKRLSTVAHELPKHTDRYDGNVKLHLQLLMFYDPMATKHHTRVIPEILLKNSSTYYHRFHDHRHEAGSGSDVSRGYKITC